MPAGTIIMNGNIHQYQGGNIGSESDRDEDNIVGEDDLTLKTYYKNIIIHRNLF